MISLALCVKANAFMPDSIKNGREYRDIHSLVDPLLYLALTIVNEEIYANLRAR